MCCFARRSIVLALPLVFLLGCLLFTTQSGKYTPFSLISPPLKAAPISHTLPEARFNGVKRQVITATVTGGGASCNGAPVAVVVTITGGLEPYDVTLTNGGGSMSGNSPLTFLVNPAVTTTYTVQDGNDANGRSYMVVGSATVTVGAANEPTVAQAGPNQGLCSPGPVTLAANVPTVGSGSWSIVSGPDTSLLQFGDVTLNTSTFTATSTGVYVLRWTITNGSCGTSTDDVQVTILNGCNSALLVADTNNHRIQRFDGSDWFLVGPGTMGSAPGQFRLPEAVTADISGQTIYVADTGNNRIQWSTDGGANWMIFATLGSGLNQVRSPQGVALDLDGNLYVSDTGNGRVLRFENGLPGLAIVIASTGTGSGQVGSPRGLVVAPDFRLFVADEINSRIVRIVNANTVLTSTSGTVLASKGVGLNKVQNPQGVTIDPTTGTLYIADTGNSRILRFPNASPNNASALALIGSALGQVNRAEGITICFFNTGPFTEGAFLVVGDTFNNRIQGRFIPTGAWSLVGSPNNVGSAIGQFRNPSKIW